MGKILIPGQNIVIPSTTFNFLNITNDSSFSLDITAMHDDIVRPIIIIRDAVKKEGAASDKAIEERLKSLEGQASGT